MVFANYEKRPTAVPSPLPLGAPKHCEGGSNGRGEGQSEIFPKTLCALSPGTVAQTSKSAVSQVSKPAGRTTSYDLPIWKSAIQQVWRHGAGTWVTVRAGPKGTIVSSKFGKKSGQRPPSPLPSTPQERGNSSPTVGDVERRAKTDGRGVIFDSNFALHFNAPLTPSEERAIFWRVTNAVNQRLQEVRNALLRLHKVLVDSERLTYEKVMGAIQSPNRFLQLLLTDPWFAWLHPLSQLIVAMDEAHDAKEPATDADAQALIEQARLLLVASEEGQGFARHYFDALQRDPDVVLAHADTMKVVSDRKPAK